MGKQIPDSQAEDVERAVASAKQAFPSWSATPAAQRAEKLYKIANLIEARLEEFAFAESTDQGKPVSFALTVRSPPLSHKGC